MALTGSCMCGAVRFEVSAPFTTAGYCHCTRCQRRTGVPWALSGMVDEDGFAIVEGAELVRSFQPPDGFAKAFCGECGGHLYAGPAGGVVAVRLGSVDGDPGVRPRWHQWVGSAPAWEPIPDDGLPRFAGPREHD